MRDVLKILFIQKRTNKAGAQVCLERTIRALNDLDVDVKVIVGENGWLVDKLEEIGALGGITPFPSFRAPLSKWLKLNLFGRTANTVWNKYGPFHIIHANDTWEALIAEWLAVRWKIPWVVHIRNATLNEFHYDKYHCHKANAVIPVSPEAYNLVKKWHYNILEYIPEGLPDSIFFSSDNRNLSFPEKVGVVGNGSMRKGWDILADAFAKVEKINGDLPQRIVFLGHIDAKHIDKIKQRLPTSIEVSFTGHVDNLVEHIRSMDIIIAPSRKENFGTVMAETIAAGVPLLSSKTGIAPYIMGEDSPWVFSTDSVDSLINAWIQLPSIWQNWRGYVQQYQQKLKEEFLIGDLTKRLISLYEKCVKNAKNGVRS